MSSATVQMTGSATDDLSGVNLVQVEISTGLSPKSYYTGSGWTPSQIWITTTTANPWIYTIPTNALFSGTLYYVRAQLTDQASNTFDTQITTFTYDTQAPAVTIAMPVANNFYSALQLSTPFAGTASGQWKQSDGCVDHHDFHHRT